MPRLKNRNPKYCLHRASGQAVVTIDNRDFYLGGHGTAASRAEYDRLIGEWLARGRRLDAGCTLTVVEVIAAYWKFSRTYYRRGDGSTTKEVSCIREALLPVKRLYGRTPVIDFGPLALKAVRNEMIDKLKWCRTNINKQIGRVKRMFKWAAAEQMIPASIFESLRTVDGLKVGRSEARESEPVKPVAEAHVDAVLPHVAPPVQAMVRLQLITGMRPGEVTAIRGCDLETGGSNWVYRPAQHKNLHRGHDRAIFLGPKAQAIIKPFLKPDTQAYLFSPAASAAWHRERRRLARTTPHGVGNEPGTNRREHPKLNPGTKYTTTAYNRAIAYGCAAAFPPPAHLTAGLKDPKKIKEKLLEWRRAHRWNVHRLRHAAATRLRKEFGLEIAQVLLGHATLTTTQIYAARNIEAAQRVMGEVG